MVIILFIFISILFGFLTFFSTNSVIVALCVLGFSLLYLFVISFRRIDKYQIKTKRYHSCYKFINSFLISLSIRNTVNASLEKVSENMDEEFKNECDGLENVTGLDILIYLKKYYRFHIYDLFINVISLFEEQGGNILQMSSLIIEQSRNIEDYINKVNSIGKRKVLEFSVLWVFAIVILIALRFVLGQFYQSIVSQTLFQIAIGIIFVFIVISIDVLISRITALDIRGWSHEEF